MFAVPIVVCGPGQEYEFHDGQILRLLPELGGSGKISAYSRLRQSGWHKIDYGFWAYTVATDENVSYVFPGLNPTGTTQKAPFNKMTKFYSREQFEKFIEHVMAFEARERQKISADFDVLVHDLRRLSTSIYHAAVEAKNALEQGAVNEAVERIENIVGAQSMLKIRTDLLDFSGNPSSDLEIKDVPIYRRVDKVVRSFRPIATRQNVTLQFSGSSFSSSRGPDVFEIVTYVLLDNAIKYSPRNSDVKIRIFEIENNIEIEIKSLGPHIDFDEREKIFRKNYRSQNAVQRGSAGSGIGLYLADMLVRRFGGRISVEVGEMTFSSSDGDVRDITFKVAVPKSGNSHSDFERKSRFS